MTRILKSALFLSALSLPGCVVPRVVAPVVDDAKVRVLEAQLPALKAEVDALRGAITQLPAGTPKSVMDLLSAKVDAAEQAYATVEAQVKAGKGIPWATVGLSVLLALFGVATGIHAPAGRGVDLLTNLMAALLSRVGARYRKPEEQPKI